MQKIQQLAQTDRVLDFQGQGDTLQGSSTTTDFGASFGSWLGNLMSILMTVSFLVLLLYLIWGAFEWITSAGDSSKLQNARNRMLHAIIGMIILASVTALILFVQYILGVEILEFGNFSQREQTNTTAPPDQPEPTTIPLFST
ncbi:MAG: pilin [Patescibacteria group bacterium]